jgi:hypothetical protein
MKAQKKPGGETRQEHSHGKDKDFQPIGRNTSLLKLAAVYSTSFNEFCSGFPPCTPTQYLFDLHDIVFKAQYLKMDSDGRFRWEI